MQATIISDTSCLILLDKIGELHLLQKLFGNIIITSIIADEFDKQLPHWISIKNASDNKHQVVLKLSLDKGEASAIALALEYEDCLLIIDEQKGRRIAKQLGLTITGTIGVLVQAKKRGFISSLKNLLHKIEQTDFRLSEQLIKEGLKQTGEAD